MRNFRLVCSGCFCLVVMLVLSGGAGPVFAEGGEPPAAHQAIREYKGPETCDLCHITTAAEVVQSLHYQQQGSVLYREGWPEDQPGGMSVSYSVPLVSTAALNWLSVLQPLDEALPAQPSGCGTCHPGLGAPPNSPTADADLDNVDCLICHGPGYERTVVVDEEGVVSFAPAEGVDALAAAQAAQRPTREMCTRCHLSADGGPNYKHGDYPTSADVDVHFAAGLDCVDCHLTQGHQVAGGGDLLVHEMPEVTVSCTNCHTDQPHVSGSAAMLNSHSARVACETCHIPAIARDPAFPTQVSSDYTVPVYDEATGLYGPQTLLENDLVPTYFWWDGRAIDSTGKPIGSLDDPQSRLTPWKAMQIAALVDSASGELLAIQRDVYQVSGDLDAAVQAAVEATGVEYSGSWEAAVQSMYLSAQHQVAPASEALQCVDCHSGEGRLDFTALGYDDDRAGRLESLAGQASLVQGGKVVSGNKPAGLSNDACMACHAQPGMTMELADGEQLYLTVDQEVYEQSVHGQAGYACVQCHTEITNIPHDPLPDLSKRDLLVKVYYTSCVSCHEDKYRETLDSVHQRELAAGNTNAAICSDCHGAHDIQAPGEPHSRSSEMCEKCHSQVFALYRDSVHGSALIDEGNPDVPSCTDCHGVHHLEGPATEQDFHLASQELCAECHNDPVLMEKYNLNADVYDTYVADFHGTTVVLYESLHLAEETNKPVCVDCHGVHDIQVHDDPESRVIKENLLVTCQRCHPDATLDFPASWLSHYRPDRENSPLVYFVDLFYKLLIPGALGFMILFNFTDVLRAVRERLAGRKEHHHEQ